MSDIYPLCSFYLLSYNQSNFIENALQGAFSQDYPNLEIIISDDNSTDDTWEKIQKFIQTHPTKHKVITNRNQRNMGICSHINHVISLAHGEYIIASAGDDISLPQRTSNCIKEFLADPQATLVHSNFKTIDEHGEIISSEKENNIADKNLSVTDLINHKYKVIGCAMAFRKSIFDCFGPMDPKCFYEDWIISCRMKLFGNIVKIDSPDVLYRASSQSLTNHLGMTLSREQKADFQKRMIKQKIFTLHCCLTDTYSYEFNNDCNIRFLSKLRNAIHKEITFQYIKYLVLQNPFGKILSMFLFNPVFIGKFFKVNHFRKKYK